MSLGYTAKRNSIIETGVLLGEEIGKKSYSMAAQYSV